MNPQKLLPLLAAALGFAIAWALKPTPTPAAAVVENAKPASKSSSRADNNRTRPSTTSGKRPQEVKPGDFPLADMAEKGPKTRTEAKMLRLTEALNLNIDQQSAIIGALEKAKADTGDQLPVIQELTQRGNDVQAALEKILTPEQLQKFEELRVRERENRIEARAQMELAKIIEEIDLSPGQREDVLARLRQYSKSEIQGIPASATLLLNTSMLPTDVKDLNIDAVLMLNQLATESPPPVDDPMGAHQQVINRQRQMLDERLQNYDGILSPAQMGQIAAIVTEKRTSLETLQKEAAQVAERAAQQAAEKEAAAQAQGAGSPTPLPTAPADPRLQSAHPPFDEEHVDDDDDDDLEE